MNVRVLDEGWLPPKLVCREEKVEELKRLILSEGYAAILGPSGVGKSTLVKLAAPGSLIIDCSERRTYASILRYAARELNIGARQLKLIEEEVIASGVLIVLDDFTLAHRDKRLRSLVDRLRDRGGLVIVGHPSIRSELIDYPLLEMPAYTTEEIYSILEDRVVLANLPVSEEALKVISSRVGRPRGPGSARLAIVALKEAIKLAVKEGTEVTERYAALALRMLEL